LPPAHFTIGEALVLGSRCGSSRPAEGRSGRAETRDETTDVGTPTTLPDQ